MTKHIHGVSFFHFPSSTLFLAYLASTGLAGQTQLDANDGMTTVEQSNLQNALLRTEPRSESPGDMRFPADLTPSDGLVPGHERQTMPDFVSGSEQDAAVIDQSGRFVKSKSSHSKLSVDPHESAKFVEVATATPVPSKTLAPATKASPKGMLTPTPQAGYHVIGLSVCIALLIGVFLVQWKSLKQDRSESSACESREHSAQESLSSGSTGALPSTGNAADDADDSQNASTKGENGLSNEAALLGLQFLGVLLLCIACTRFLVCNGFKMQCDEGYNLGLFFRQDFHKVVLDMVFLFIFGRLAATSPLPINSPAFVAVVFVSALVPSWSNELSFMKHSLSMYQMACSWTAMTWVVSSTIFGVIVALVVTHLHHFILHSSRADKARAVMELVVILGVFVLPVAFQSGFHMHHWFTMWLLAIGCRMPTLWSRGAQAFLIGGYINGIAVYGRDPVLACEAAYDMSYSQQCKFLMMCQWTTAAGVPGVGPPPFMSPDWRTCTAGDYT